MVPRFWFHFGPRVSVDALGHHSLPSSPHHLSHLWAAAYAVPWVWATLPQLAPDQSQLILQLKCFSVVKPLLTPAGSLGVWVGAPLLCVLWVLEDLLQLALHWV